MTALVSQAADAGARLVAFPELAFTDYFPKRPFPGVEASRPLFQQLPDDATAGLFAEADKLGVSLIVPFAEWADGQRYNAALLWEAGSGPAGVYRKVHTPHPVEFAPGQTNAYESDWFAAGTNFPTFELAGTQVGVQICFDRHFPESTRCLALKGAQVVFICSNSQSYGKPWRAEVWDMICRIRAYENTVFIVGVNKTGIEDGEVDWHGRSCIVSPLGKIIAQAGNDGRDGVIVADLDLADVKAERRTRRFLEERRPEAYAALIEPISPASSRRQTPAASSHAHT